MLVVWMIFLKVTGISRNAIWLWLVIMVTRSSVLTLMSSSFNALSFSTSTVSQEFYTSPVYRFRCRFGWNLCPSNTDCSCVKLNQCRIMTLQKECSRTYSSSMIPGWYRTSWQLYCRIKTFCLSGPWNPNHSASLRCFSHEGDANADFLNL